MTPPQRTPIARLGRAITGLLFIAVGLASPALVVLTTPGLSLVCTREGAGATPRCTRTYVVPFVRRTAQVSAPELARIEAESTSTRRGESRCRLVLRRGDTDRLEISRIGSRASCDEDLASIRAFIADASARELRLARHATYGYTGMLVVAPIGLLAIGLGILILLDLRTAAERSL